MLSLFCSKIFSFGIASSNRYGLMDAAAMVKLARNWTRVPQQRLCEVKTALPKTPLTMEIKAMERLVVSTDACRSHGTGHVRYLEHVQAKVRAPLISY